MNKQVELIKAEIERLKQPFKEDVEDNYYPAYYCALLDIGDFINSLPEEPKFNVGDMVISTKNPSLTYKVLQVGLPNELGKLDYEVEIFTDGKTGIKVGNTFEEHNIHLISCDKMDEWGKLLEEPVSENRNKELSLSLGIQAFLNTCSDELYAKGKLYHTPQKSEEIHQCMRMWQKLHNAYFYTKEEHVSEDLEGIIRNYFGLNVTKVTFHDDGLMEYTKFVSKQIRNALFEKMSGCNIKSEDMSYEEEVDATIKMNEMLNLLPNTIIKYTANHFVQWKEQQFEKNRLAACDRQAKRGSG